MNARGISIKRFAIRRMRGLSYGDMLYPESRPGGPMNRRNFLMTTAAVATTTSSMLASANDTVRMAVVGCGGRGMSHVNAWTSLPNVELVALCDPDQSHLDKYVKAVESKGKKKPDTYADVRKLLEDKNIDAISIASPN